MLKSEIEVDLKLKIYQYIEFGILAWPSCYLIGPLDVCRSSRGESDVIGGLESFCS